MELCQGHPLTRRWGWALTWGEGVEDWHGLLTLCLFTPQVPLAVFRFCADAKGAWSSPQPGSVGRGQ